MANKLLQTLSVLLISLISINSVSAIDSMDNNTFSKCKENLEYETTKSMNPVDAKMQSKIRKLGPLIEKKYDDKKLLLLNNKIISLLSKQSKTSKQYNLYAFLLNELDNYISEPKKTDDYKKAVCGLLLKPVNSSGLTQDLLIKAKENKETVKEYNKISEKSDLTAAEIQESANATAEKYGLYKSQDIYEEERYQERINTYTNALNKISDEDYINKLDIALQEKSVPFGLGRDSKYDIELTKEERKIYENHWNVLLEASRKHSEAMFVPYEIRLPHEKAHYRMEKIDEIKDTFNYKNALIHQKLYLIRKKWERKNICLTQLGKTFIKDRDTFKSISLRDTDELKDLKDDYQFAKVNGYDLSCRLLKVYPILKTTYAEMINMSDSEIDKLINTKIEKPSSWTYPEIIWGDRQANIDYETAIKMKRLLFIPMESIKKEDNFEKNFSMLYSFDQTSIMR